MKSDKDLKTELKTSEFELLVPANNVNIAKKAINAGADAIYIGYSKYGARSRAGNSIEDIIELIEYAHTYRVKIYVTLNTILKDEEIKKVENLIWHLYAIKTDGLIIQDMGILKLNLPPIPIFASTQCHNNTIEKIKFLEETGIKRVILPRETSLEEIKNICKNTNAEIETFIHGALCVSYSGQCYLSYSIGKRSANRGECAQPCRKKYSLKDFNGKYIVKNKYILSLKDLNLSNRLKDLITAGVTSFKIEGRLKNETYVVNTTAYYRLALDKILNELNLKRASVGQSTIDFEPDLNKTFNRGYTNFNLDGTKKDLCTFNYNSSIGEYLGTVKFVKKNYFSLNSTILNNGDGICFFNENSELQGTNINKVDGEFIFPADIKGIKKGTKIYRNYNKEFDDKLKNANITRKIAIKLKIKEINSGYIFFATDEENNTATYMISKDFEPAQNKEKALSTINIQLAKLGDTEFCTQKIDIKLQNIPFVRIAQINEIRRNLINSLRRIRRKNYNYKKRLTPIKKINYPISQLDYKANIYNKKAQDFYAERGCEIKEFALETQNNFKNKIILTSKYCIKNQLGLCSKQTPIKKYVEPYILTDEFNKEYLVEFNCKKCEMTLKILTD